ncbi:hypothetical protein PHYC_03722 [Phycisphaerales bacterium]|nr:hypothetical protein PHYC_03722 [Phycisphaerales bacterium]
MPDANPDNPNFSTRLSGADEAALDALIAAGLDPRRVTGADTRRVDRVLSLFNLLGFAPASPANVGAALVDVTMARILRAGSHADEAQLSPDDQEALDAFMTVGQRADRVPGPLRDRAERLEKLGALATGPTGQRVSPNLTERTMARIPARVRPQERSFRATLGGFRLTDLVSMAAVVMIAGSVVWPVLSTIRTHQKRGDCGANFASLASAFGLYSNDHRDQLPMATAGLGGANWLEVGSGPGRSNSANLFRLPKLNYASLKTLACPGNGGAACGPCRPDSDDWGCISEVSYSYQNMFGAQRPSWRSGSQSVILADGSPAVRGALSQTRWVPMQNSANHDGKGQWVLLTDGSGGWITSPEVNGDNIWLTDLQQKIVDDANDRLRPMGMEVRSVKFFQTVPESDRDSFLGP